MDKFQTKGLIILVVIILGAEVFVTIARGVLLKEAVALWFLFLLYKPVGQYRFLRIIIRRRGSEQPQINTGMILLLIFMPRLLAYGFYLFLTLVHDSRKSVISQLLVDIQKQNWRSILEPLKFSWLHVNLTPCISLVVDLASITYQSRISAKLVATHFSFERSEFLVSKYAR